MARKKKEEYTKTRKELIYILAETIEMMIRKIDGKEVSLEYFHQIKDNFNEAYEHFSKSMQDFSQTEINIFKDVFIIINNDCKDTCGIVKLKQFFVENNPNK